MVEPWPLEMEYRHAAGRRQLSIRSDQRLNLVLTPASFRSIGDLLAFVHKLRTQSSLQPSASEGSSNALERSLDKWIAVTHGKMATLYRCGPDS